MQRLISDNIFEAVTIYDYQAICFEVVREPDSAARILNVIFNYLPFVLNSNLIYPISALPSSFPIWWFCFKDFNYDGF